MRRFLSNYFGPSCSLTHGVGSGVNCGCSDDGGKVQLNNQRDAASRQSSISCRPASPHQTTRRASSVSRYSAADVTGSRDSRKTSIACGPSRQHDGSGLASNIRAQTSVGSASLDEYQHNGRSSSTICGAAMLPLLITTMMRYVKDVMSTSTTTWSATPITERRTGSE